MGNPSQSYGVSLALRPYRDRFLLLNSFKSFFNAAFFVCKFTIIAQSHVFLTLAHVTCRW